MVVLGVSVAVGMHRGALVEVDENRPTADDASKV
jgi:hypothetical protein